MPSRRPFSLGASSKTQKHEPELPSAEDFSIEGILRVIEPDIRGTLDSIAEICGRSRLSLANEYGSHIAPLGEIRAPPGGLVTVEEAGPSHERQLADNVVIYDDDSSFVDGRAHHHDPHSYYDYFEMRQAGTMGHPAGYQSIPEDRPSAQAQPDTSRLMVDLNFGACPFFREFTSRPGSYCRAFLGKPHEPGDHTKDIQTPAVVSEVHIIARANEAPLSAPDLPNTGVFAADPTESHGRMPSQPSARADLHALFSWFKQGPGDSASSPSKRQTAEVRLRETLERQASRNISQAA